MILSSVPPAAGFIYALAMTALLVVIWRTGRWRPRIGGALLAVSTALGFLIFSPVMPYQFQQLVLREGPGAPLVVGVAGLAVFALLAAVVGRFFCGYLCPVGAVQEIAYRVPAPKVRPTRKRLFQGARAVVFVAFLGMAFVFSISLLALFGIREFFSLAPTVGSAVFAGVMLVSAVFYRPFCRLVCPYGLILSLAAAVGLCRLRRTEACIGCGRCERACPTDEAKREDVKAECYLCGRCTQICPVEGALVYGRRQPFSRKETRMER